MQILNRNNDLCIIIQLNGIFFQKSINFLSSIKTLNYLSIRYLCKLQYLCARKLKT